MKSSSMSLLHCCFAIFSSHPQVYSPMPHSEASRASSALQIPFATMQSRKPFPQALDQCSLPRCINKEHLPYLNCHTSIRETKNACPSNCSLSRAILNILGNMEALNEFLSIDKRIKLGWVPLLESVCDDTFSKHL